MKPIETVKIEEGGKKKEETFLCKDVQDVVEETFLSSTRTVRAGGAAGGERTHT